MSFTLSFKKDKKSVPIARIKKNDKLTDRIVYLNPCTESKNDINNTIDEETLTKIMKELKIPKREQPRYFDKIEHLFTKNVDHNSFYSDDEMLMKIYKKCFENIKINCCDKITLGIGEIFTIYPCESDANRYYVAGQSKSGKSYIVKDILDNYVHKSPKSEVYLISNLKEDETLDETKADLIKVDIDDFINNPPELEEFANDHNNGSMIVFDDYEYNKVQKINTIIQGLINSVCFRGRHLGGGINAIFCPHLLTDSNKSKGMLSESSNYVVFPKKVVKRKLEYLLTTYANLDTEQIRYVQNVNSRWVCINRDYKFCISEHEIQLFQ